MIEKNSTKLKAAEAKHAEAERLTLIAHTSCDDKYEAYMAVRVSDSDKGREEQKVAKELDIAKNKYDATLKEEHKAYRGLLEFKLRAMLGTDSVRDFHNRIVRKMNAATRRYDAGRHQAANILYKPIEKAKKQFDDEIQQAQKQRDALRLKYSNIHNDESCHYQRLVNKKRDADKKQQELSAAAVKANAEVDKLYIKGRDQLKDSFTDEWVELANNPNTTKKQIAHLHQRMNKFWRNFFKDKNYLKLRHKAIIAWNKVQSRDNIVRDDAEHEEFLACRPLSLCFEVVSKQAYISYDKIYKPAKATYDAIIKEPMAIYSAFVDKINKQYADAKKRRERAELLLIKIKEKANALSEMPTLGEFIKNQP